MCVLCFRSKESRKVWEVEEEVPKLSTNFQKDSNTWWANELLIELFSQRNIKPMVSVPLWGTLWIIVLFLAYMILRIPIQLTSTLVCAVRLWLARVSQCLPIIVLKLKATDFYLCETPKFIYHVVLRLSLGVRWPRV